MCIRDSSYLSYLKYTIIPKTIIRLRTGHSAHPQIPAHLAKRTVVRERELAKIESVLRNNSFESKYYIFCGKKGVGKSTLFEVAIQKLKKEQGIIYVKAEQTPNLMIFNHDLSRALNFSVTHKKITDGSIFTYIWSGMKAPEIQGELNELILILNHMEEACKRFQHRSNYRKPTLIVDHVTYLADNNPQALTILQAKAKYWADHNLITVIFVGTDGRAPLLLYQSTDRLRMSFIEIMGLDNMESINFILEELQDYRDRDEDAYDANVLPRFEEYFKAMMEFNNNGNNNNNIKKIPPLNPKQLSPHEIVNKVVEYFVYNYVGGSFMDLLKFLEEVRMGAELKDIEDKFMNKAYFNLMEANLLFDPPFDKTQISVFRSIKKMLGDPRKSITFREFRVGLEEKKVLEILSKNVFLYNRETGFIRFQSPAIEKYILSDVENLNSALAEAEPQKPKPKIIMFSGRESFLSRQGLARFFRVSQFYLNSYETEGQMLDDVLFHSSLVLDPQMTISYSGCHPGFAQISQDEKFYTFYF
eukprot:TRINITY_DN4163_c0_g2_i4.p1 TRINITY_DN4163_c0_g2~~TRINITY_DN4163_c0_g2_i4.p1  ORF type:complete len:530 (+),score=85.82 TRINITY_DN4163_c0_g2_i4:65-1654(+)